MPLNVSTAVPGGEKSVSSAAKKAAGSNKLKTLFMQQHIRGTYIMVYILLTQELAEND
jgi:hypothetical protein